MKSRVCNRVERKCSHIDASFCLPGLSPEEKKKDRNRRRKQRAHPRLHERTETFLCLVFVKSVATHCIYYSVFIPEWVSRQRRTRWGGHSWLKECLKPRWFHGTVKRLAESSHICCSFISAYWVDSVWYLKYWNTGWYEHLFDNILAHALKYFCQIRAWGADWAD